MDAPSSAFGRHLALTSPSPLAIEVVHASGAVLTDRQGREYLDLIAGLAVNNVGHRHPDVVAAIRQQTDAFLHVIPYGEFVQAPQIAFAERLCGLLPEPLDQVYFVNSGTEAIEAAMKLAKRVTGRTRIMACHKSYHGSTHGALSITGNEHKKYRNRPLLPDVHFITFNDPSDLDRITPEVAAVFVETVQGDAGVRIPDAEWMRLLRQRCTATGALLVLDEVQTGFGRTGRLFAFEHFGIVPDILVLGKALGGGLPMGAFVSARHHMELLMHDPVLGHITTFGGHPLPCVSGLAALNALIAEDMPGNAVRLGDLFKELLVHPAIQEVRGIGAMLAVDLGHAERVRDVVLGCLEQGVLGFWFLSCPTAFRIAPPLCMTEEQVRRACTVILSEIDRHAASGRPDQ